MLNNINKYLITIVILNVIIAILIIKLLSPSNGGSNDYKDYLLSKQNINQIARKSDKTIIAYFISDPIEEEVLDILKYYKSKTTNYYIIIFLGKSYTPGISTDSLTKDYAVYTEDYVRLSTLFSIGKYATILFYPGPLLNIRSRYNYICNPFTLLEDLNGTK